MIRAWFVNMLGEQFSKDFETLEEFEAFIDRARQVGTKLIGSVGI